MHHRWTLTAALITTEAHEDAKARMTQAGAALADVIRPRGGSAALMHDYVIAQVTAGLVPAPSFLSATAGAAS